MPTLLPETTTIKPVAYAYARVSTTEQAKTGMSLEDQQQKTRAFYDYQLKAQDILWGDVYIDAGVSAAKHAFRDRPVGRKLFEQLRPGDHVIMTRLDRGFRRFRDAIQTIDDWISMGIHVHFLDLGLSTTTHGGRFILRIFAAIAEMQRDIIVEGITAGLAQRKALIGVSTGHAPVGYKLVGTGKSQRLVDDPHDRSIVALAIRLREQNGWNKAELVRQFRDRGILTHKGTLWNISRLSKGIHRAILECWTTPAAALPPIKPLRSETRAPRPARIPMPRNPTTIEVSPTTKSSLTPSADSCSGTQETAPTTFSIATESSSTTAPN